MIVQRQAETEVGAEAGCTVHLDVPAQGAQGLTTIINTDTHAGSLGRIEWQEQPGAKENNVHAASGVDDFNNRPSGLLESPQRDLAGRRRGLKRILQQVADRAGESIAFG